MNENTKQPPKADTVSQVLEFETNDVFPAPGNRPVSPDSVGDLLASMCKVGQQVPGIVYPHPEMPGKKLCADGNRRLTAARILGLKFKAILLECAPSSRELRRLRISTNTIRKAMTADQVAAEIEGHIAETADTQEQAAEFFALSPGYVSKLLAPSKSLCAELHHLRENQAICRDVLRIIARMPTPDLQRRLAERVLSTINAGGAVSRETVEGWKEGMVSKPAKKAKPVQGRGKCLSYSFTTDDHDIALAETLGLAEGIRKALKHSLPLSSLPALLKN